MKSLKEIYSEIAANDELKNGLIEAAKSGTLKEFLAKNNIGIDEAQLKKLVEGELGDDELDAVVGGNCTGDGDYKLGPRLRKAAAIKDGGSHDILLALESVFGGISPKAEIKDTLDTTSAKTLE